MPLVIFIKSEMQKEPVTQEGDELSTYEKLKAALEERVKDATTDRDRERAERELKEFTRTTRHKNKDSC